MACLLLVAVACGGQQRETTEPPDADEHVTPVEAPTDTVYEQAFPLGDGQIAIAGLPPLTVHEDVTVESVAIGTASGTAVLLGARVSATEVKSGCLRTWPPPSAKTGATVPAQGATLRAGDTPRLVLYLRPTGDAVVDQVVVRYAHGDEHTELRWNAVKLDLRVGTAARCG